MSTADLQRRVDKLELDLARLRHQVPVRIGIPDTRPLAITIIGGQSFGTFDSIESFGILRYHLGILTGIPNGTYDPGTVDPATGEETGSPTPAIDSWPQGLGYGTSWDGAEYSRVIVVNDTRGTSSTALIGGADDDATYAPSWRQETIISERQVSVSKLDGTLVLAWSPDLS